MRGRIACPDPATHEENDSTAIPPIRWDYLIIPNCLKYF